MTEIFHVEHEDDPDCRRCPSYLNELEFASTTSTLLLGSYASRSILEIDHCPDLPERARDDLPRTVISDLPWAMKGDGHVS